MNPYLLQPESIVTEWRERQRSLDRTLEICRQASERSVPEVSVSALVLGRAGDLLIAAGSWLRDRSEPVPQSNLIAGR